MMTPMKIEMLRIPPGLEQPSTSKFSTRNYPNQCEPSISEEVHHSDVDELYLQEDSSLKNDHKVYRRNPPRDRKLPRRYPD